MMLFMMTRLCRRLFTAALYSTLFFSYGYSQTLFKSQNPTVAKVGKERIQLDELSHFFSRNYTQKPATVSELQDFLKDYALYRAKIQEAERLGMHLDEQFLNEYAEFEKNAAPSYWIENSMKDQLLDEFVERSQTEVLVSHVLIRLEEKAAPDDTLQAFNTLLRAREEFISGASMDSLNEVYSSRVRGAAIGGDIPWFSAGTTVHEFENVAYSLEINEISMPVRTQFGYHLIYLQDRRPRTPGRFTSHIFFRNALDTQERLDSAIVLLKNGALWDDVVDRYSDDRQSAPNGGSLGLIGYNLRFPEEFSEIVLGLNTQNEWSEPIQTMYGTHIFRIDSVEQVEMSAKRLSELEQQLRQLPRYKLDEEDVISKIQNSTYFERLASTDEVISTIFESNTDGSTPKWEDLYSSDITTKPLFSIQNRSYTVGHFIDWVRSAYPELTPNDISPFRIDLYSQDLIQSSIGDITANEFPAFAETRTQFYHGLLVFKLNEKFIWDPQSVDSARVRSHFDQNLELYLNVDSEEDTDESKTELTFQQKDELFNKVYFRVFSDMQPILEEEFNSSLFERYRIKLFLNRIR